MPILLRKFRELKVSVCLLKLDASTGPISQPGRATLVSASRTGRESPYAGSELSIKNGTRVTRVSVPEGTCVWSILLTLVHARGYRLGSVGITEDVP